MLRALFQYEEAGDGVGDAASAIPAGAARNGEDSGGGGGGGDGGRASAAGFADMDGGGRPTDRTSSATLAL